MIDYIERLREQEAMEQQIEISRKNFERCVMVIAVLALIAIIFI